MAPSVAKVPLTPATATPAESLGATDDASTIKGPHPGYVSVAGQYTTEQQLRRMLKDNGCDSVGEDRFRLLGVQLIDNVRESLQLPVRTFDTACTYYHKFRLNFRDAEYNYQDAALAALFVACKVEDTIKKSKEILCAAYNLKNADHTTAQDDKMFEQPSKIIIGLERLNLETIGFDFRGRYPQKYLVKVVKNLLGPDHSKAFYDIAYDMCTDLYKTFAVIKQSTFTMVISIIELTALIIDTHLEEATKLNAENWHTTRKAVVETMLDLLDLYTQHPKSTKIGTQFDINKFIEIKISINSEVDSTPGLSRFPDWCERCDVEEPLNPITHTPGSATSPATTTSFPGSNSVKRNARNQDGTLRFVFDPDLARHEQDVVGEYFREEYEEYEVEVEEVIPEPEHRHRERGHGHESGGRGSHHHPRHRNHHHDRHKGRRGYY